MVLGETRSTSATSAVVNSGGSVRASGQDARVASRTDIDGIVPAVNAPAGRQEIVGREHGAKQSRRAARLGATADRWLRGTLQWASGTHGRTEELWRSLYPPTGKRGRPRAPRAVRIWLVWRARILCQRGFSSADALDVLVARFGPAALLSDLDRAQSEFDDLVESIAQTAGWHVPSHLKLPRSAGVPQAHTARRGARERSQQAMFKRLAWLQARIPEHSREDELVDLAPHELALMRAALSDEKLRRLAEASLPPQSRAKRPRGRPPNRRAATDSSIDRSRDPAVLMPHEWTPTDREIVEAVIRYALALSASSKDQRAAV
jgi:hypothetical protein